MDHLATVLTGDLIRSTQVGQSAVDGAMGTIASVAKHEAEISGLDVRFARFRGDGWQLYCPDAARVFRLTVLVLANLHSRPTLAQTRLAVATGTVSVLPPKGLASASGEVFTMSGHALDDMTTDRLVFCSQTTDAKWQKPLFSYLEWQSSRWSPQQAEAISLAFRYNPPQPRKSAEELGISRQAFKARLDGAGYEPLWDANRPFNPSEWFAK